MKWSSQIQNNQNSIFTQIIDNEKEQKSNLFNHIYQTPIKESQIPQPQNFGSKSPFQFDFNFYFGNLFSSGKIPTPHLESSNSSHRLQKENNFFLFKNTTFEKSGFKFSGSDYKVTTINRVNNNSSNITNNINNNFIYYNNNNFENNENLNCNFNGINNSNFCNFNSSNNSNKMNFFNLEGKALYKRNLNQMFDDLKNDRDKNFLNFKTTKYERRNIKNKDIKKDIYKNKANQIPSKNKKNINKITEISLNSPSQNKINILNDIKNKEDNNKHINNDKFCCSDVCKIKKKIFECSNAQTFACTSEGKVFKGLSRKRYRKNNQQLEKLKYFYSENKIWNKNQIRSISKEIGLKENKVYKWLWDQKNKELKSVKFYIQKNK